MIDKLGFIVTEDGDGGDTANREGQMSYIADVRAKQLLYIATKGPTRHPEQFPWDNPKNFTRDQATPLMAALGKIGAYVFIKAFLYGIFKRFGFLPNIERDAPGTTKHPYPHRVPANEWQKAEFRWFDYADWAGSEFIGMCIISGRIKHLYLLLPWCTAMMYLSVRFYSKTEDDCWQMAIMCDVYDQFLGTKYLKMLNDRRSLRDAALTYFGRRGMADFFGAWLKFLYKRGV